MERPEISYGFPKPGPGLKAVLAAITVLGILGALLMHVGSVGRTVFELLDCTTAGVFGLQLWRLVTAGLLTAPDSFQHLLFTLIGLYFLSPDLERRWGTPRFLAFLGVSTVVGFSLAVLTDLVAPASFAMLHQQPLFGAGAAMSATAIAWSQANAHAQVRLFFFLPMSGRALFWVTIGFCVIGLIYGGSTEGVVAPFGGVLTALIAAGEPSPLRRLYLRIKLMVLRSRVGGVPTARDIIAGAAPGQARRPRRDGPPLRVVRGGQSEPSGGGDADDGGAKRRDPPKDKRYLN
jgi:membrane associated rhomboid family serine protease